MPKSQSFCQELTVRSDGLACIEYTHQHRLLLGHQFNVIHNRMLVDLLSSSALSGMVYFTLSLIIWREKPTLG